jgi:hypothetical protein
MALYSETLSDAESRLKGVANMAAPVWTPNADGFIK